MKPWGIVCFSNSDNAADRSISGCLLYVLGVPVFLYLKGQRSMALLSSDKEWVPLLEA